MALIWVDLAEGLTQTITSTLFCHWTVARDAPCLSRSAEPTRARETATVSTAATVIRRFRQRLVTASLET